MVHERILEANKHFPRIEFGEFVNHRSVAPSKLIRINSLVDAVGIEPTTCRSRVAGKSRFMLVTVVVSELLGTLCLCGFRIVCDSSRFMRFAARSPWYFPRYDFQRISALRYASI